MIKYSRTILRDRKTDDIDTTLSLLRNINANWNYASSTTNFNMYKIEEHQTDSDLTVKPTKDVRGLV